MRWFCSCIYLVVCVCHPFSKMWDLGDQGPSSPLSSQHLEQCLTPHSPDLRTEHRWGRENESKSSSRQVESGQIREERIAEEMGTHSHSCFCHHYQPIGHYYNEWTPTIFSLSFSILLIKFQAILDYTYRFARAGQIH